MWNYCMTHLPMALGLLVVIAPAWLVFSLGVSSLVGRPLSEPSIMKFVQSAIWVGLMAAVAVLGWMLFVGETRLPIELGNWVHIG